jgi:hypothetical protein
VTAVFADRFYWAALTSTDDRAHNRAMEFSRSMKPNRIVTTDEVLTEYLAFFARARPSVRLQAGENAAALIGSPFVMVMPQSRESFLAGPRTLPGASGQRLQPDRLHFNAGRRVSAVCSGMSESPDKLKRVVTTVFPSIVPPLRCLRRSSADAVFHLARAGCHPVDRSPS